MLEIDIPGHKRLRLHHLVLDYNGTVACDGNLLQGVKDRLEALAEKLTIHVLTADTFGKAREELKELPCELTVLPVDDQDRGKLQYIQTLGPDSTVCIGNGRNDRLMLKEAALGIAVVLEEGAAVGAVESADVLCTSVCGAMDLLLCPLRLIATLRS